ncbi:MAG: hypothetical protein AAGF97_08860 [Planctomycetota bacterium]
MELTLALALLLMMVYVFMQVSVRLHRSMELNRQQIVALECVQNVADELFLADLDNLNVEQLGDWELPAWAAARLPEGRLIVSQQPAFDPQALTITVRWQHGVPREVGTTVFRASAAKGEMP